MNRNILLYIQDIVENIKKAEEFTKGMSYEEFIKDEKTGYAVIRCIEIMGEAAKQVPEAIRQKHPQIPWRDIAGMRDKVVHFYFGVNLEKVWLVMEKDIPELKPLIKNVLKDLQSKGEQE